MKRKYTHEQVLDAEDAMETIINDKWRDKIDLITNLEAHEQMCKLLITEIPNYRDQDSWMFGFNKAIDLVLEILND